jgi:hypothetical protein
MAAEVMDELVPLDDPRASEVNAKDGDDHGVNFGKLRAREADQNPQQLALEL